MQRITYAGGSYLADDGMAEAVLRYARVLAERRDVDIVRVHIGRPDGNVGSAWLLIGAGIPIGVESVPEDMYSFDGELAEPDVERRLRRMAELLSTGPVLRPDPDADNDEPVDPFL
ncbi:hypothetical protein [Agromyces silvae]|uniref:hypothetical protein n=1 Tax=Agromyces silvae TaxID=3388266 RepID=UPI00280ACEE3|nr:hypothetical protein [Agromyces protaetiae]